MGKRILLVWDRLGDYHRARVSALENNKGCQAVYTADLGSNDPLYKWKNTEADNHFVLSGKPVDTGDFMIRTLQFLKILLSRRINTVGISGYGRNIYILFIILSRLLGKQVVIFAESWYGTRTKQNKLKAFFLHLFATGIFVSGERAEAFFRKTLSLQAKKIEVGYSAVDNDHFAIKDSIRRNMIEYPHVLCVARFSREKNLERMILAFLNSDLANRYHLKIVGDGPLWIHLNKRFEQRSEIIFTPWVSYAELPIAYHQASALVLASSFEPWGLVVNEAMAAGLPIIASKQVGCIPDLIDQSNGFIFDAYRELELKYAFNQFDCLSLQEKHIMGDNSVRKIKQFTVSLWAERFLKLLT